MSNVVDFDAYRKKRKLIPSNIPSRSKPTIDYYGIGRSPYGGDIKDFPRYKTLDEANDGAIRIQRAFKQTIYVFECVSTYDANGNRTQRNLARGVYYRDDKV